MNVDREALPRLGRVLLATDGSPDARLAARVAADLALKTGADLHVAHAWTRSPQGFAYSAVVWTDYSYLFERQARRLLEGEVDAVEAEADLQAEPHLLHGPPVDAILDLCDELQPGLVVMGSRGLGPLGRLLVGSVSEGVVHHARTPVLIVRGGEEAWPPERVIVGEDGSEGAALAAELGLGVARLYGARDSLVRAHRNPPEPIGGWSAEDRGRLDGIRAGIEADLGKRAEALRKTLGHGPETRVAEGDTTLALLVVAEEGDGAKTTIAVGSRGLGAIGRARLGSVSTNVLRVAAGPVLICPQPREAAYAGAPPRATVLEERSTR